jgi:hypothetical protein
VKYKTCIKFIDDHISVSSHCLFHNFNGFHYSFQNAYDTLCSCSPLPYPPPSYWFHPTNSPPFAFMSFVLMSRFHIWEKYMQYSKSGLLVLTIMISSSIHFHANVIVAFFVRPNNAPLCMYTYFLYPFMRWAPRLIP